MFLVNSAVIAFLLVKPPPAGQPTSLLLAAIGKNALQRCGWHNASFPMQGVTWQAPISIIDVLNADYNPGRRKFQA